MSFNTLPANPYPPSTEQMNAGGGGGSYVLPVASAETLGGVKVGANLSIADGVLSASASGLTKKSLQYTGNGEGSTVIDFGNDTPAVILGIYPDPDETYAGGDYNSIMAFGWKNLLTMALWAGQSGGVPTGGGGTNMARMSYDGNVVTITSSNNRASCNVDTQKYRVDYLA